VTLTLQGGTALAKGPTAAVYSGSMTFPSVAAFGEDKALACWLVPSGSYYLYCRVLRISADGTISVGGVVAVSHSVYRYYHALSVTLRWTW